MRLIWTLFKLVIVLAIAIPLGIVALSLALGVLGALVGLAIIVLKFACLGLLGYGAYRLIRAMLGGSSAPKAAPQLEPVDPYYEAAMRELDREIGRTPRA